MSTTLPRLPRLPDFEKYLPELRLTKDYHWCLSNAACDMLLKEGEWFEVVQKVMDRYLAKLNGRVYDDSPILVYLTEKEDQDDD